MIFLSFELFFCCSLAYNLFDLKNILVIKFYFIISMRSNV